MYTITRNTRTGIQEVLTDKGFKTREWLEFNDAQILWFDKIEIKKKVNELKKDCRIPAIAKSIQLNYA